MKQKLTSIIGAIALAACTATGCDLSDKINNQIKLTDLKTGQIPFPNYKSGPYQVSVDPKTGEITYLTKQGHFIGKVTPEKTFEGKTPVRYTTTPFTLEINGEKYVCTEVLKRGSANYWEPIPGGRDCYKAESISR